MAIFTDEIVLTDSVSGPAKAAQLQVKTLESGLASAQRALVKAGALGDQAGFNKALAGVDKYSIALKGLSPDIRELAGEEAKAKAESIEAKLAAAANASALKLASKDKAASIAKDAKLEADALKTTRDEAKAFGAAFDAGIGMAVSAMKIGVKAAAAFAVAIAGAGLYLAKLTIEASESKQEMLTLFDTLSDGKKSAVEIEGVIDGLKSKFGISKDSMIGWSTALLQAGTSSDQLEGKLISLAQANAINQKGGADAYLAMAAKLDVLAETGKKLVIPAKGLAKLAEIGVNVSEVAKAMGVSSEELGKQLTKGGVDAKLFGEAIDKALGAKGPKALERMASSSKNIGKLLKESISDIFEDVDVGPFMAQVKSLFDIFGQGTESGKALKSGLGGGMQFLFNKATELIPIIKRMFLQFAIYALEAYIAMVPLYDKLVAFGKTQEAAILLDAMGMALKAVAIQAGVAVGIVALVTGIIGIATAQFGLFMVAVEAVKQTLISWSLGATQAADEFVVGLINGITGGIPKFIQSIKSLANAGLVAWDTITDSHSPSEAMRTRGGFLGEGAALGVEDSSARVEGASAAMGASVLDSAVSVGSSGQTASAPAASGAVQVFVQIDGAGKSAMDITEEMITLVWERMAARQGATT